MMPTSTKYSYFPIAILYIFLSSFITTVSAEVRENPSWRVKKSEHFIIYYREAPQEYLDDVVTYAERYYNDITSELGFTRFEGFWTWEERARIYLYDNAREYRAMAKQPGWSSAGVNVYTREIKTYVNMMYFFNDILPHELGHIIFREFVGFNRPLPLWLDEGVVSYLELSRRGERLKAAKALVRMKGFMSLEELNKIKVLKRTVSPDFFYSESVSAIGFLMDTYGKEKFVSFCRCLRELRDDQDWLSALNDVYGFRDLSEMNEKWVEFLKR